MLLDPTNVLLKDLTLYYWLKLILNSHKGLAPFRQKRILLGLLVTQIYKKKNNEDFFIQLLYSWLHLTNNNFATSCLNFWLTHIFKPTHQSILSLMSNNLYFYSISTRNISDKFTIIREPSLNCRFLQPGLISTTGFEAATT